ncbi:hypothetical protein BKA66DRAFT_566614 [Pyrenochaeta sp. MPI-SDFR-AT-0127]|nr:hypothetical protein BKA66DRAFT_566614 [Pyrenochaeta sp. MPI-SDFR-AT-0127]
MTTGHSTPRAGLLSTTFWEVLPSNYNKIKARWEKIFRLYNESKSGLLASDRDGATNSLKVELEMLEHDLQNYRDIVKGIDITDMAGIYVTAGKSPHRALQIAKEDFEHLERSLKQVEEKITEVRADVAYGRSDGI